MTNSGYFCYNAHIFQNFYLNSEFFFFTRNMSYFVVRKKKITKAFVSFFFPRTIAIQKISKELPRVSSKAK